MTLNKKIALDNSNPWNFGNSMEIKVVRLGKNRGVNQIGKRAKTTNCVRQSLSSNDNDDGLNEREKRPLRTSIRKNGRYTVRMIMVKRVPYACMDLFLFILKHYFQWGNNQIRD